MIKEEWKRLLHNPMLIIVLLAIILIPSIYAGFFLASMWDPYGELDKLPVAVVNLDKPVEYDGKELTVGSDLVDNLKSDASLDFSFVSKEDAEAGLRSGKYYMVVTIPEDFSQCAATVTDNDPHKMELKYETNPATNYVAMKLSESAMTKMQLSLQEKVTETYAKSVYDKLGQIGTGFGDAADGASKLLDGEKKLTDGVNDLNEGASNLAKGASDLSDGASKLKDGAVTFNNGIKDYLDGTTKVYDGTVALKNGLTGLHDGTESLASGARNLADGTTQLSQGAAVLADGSSQMATGASDLAQGTKQLADGAANLSQGAASLSQGLNDLSGQVPALASGINSVAQGASNLNKGISDYTQGVSDTLTGASQLKGGLDKMTQGTASLNAASGNIKNNIDSLSALASNIASSSDDPNIKALADGLASLKNGYSSFNSNIAGIDKTVQTLDQGAASLEDGLKTLDNNSTALTNGAMALDKGASDLNNAVPSLSDGINKLAAGATSLSEGATALSAGAKDVNTGANTVAGAAGKISSGASSLGSGIADAENGARALADGASQLNSGAGDALNGAADLSDGANTLVSNNDKIAEGASSLANGASSLSTGAAKLDKGSDKLSTGTNTLAGSVPELSSGTEKLRDSLQGGADEISDTARSDANAAMFSNPVVLEETKLTNVEDNGHAMAAYMMSVGLWVACLAFCLMYPLTKHDGLTSGFSWWLSKASVLYPMAILQAVVLVGILHFALGFEPARIGQTISVACLTSVAFMSIMYFFNVLMGKVGSFIMLIFMVLQLAGSAGTYPIEVSGPLAAGLNRFMPFTYTVQAFRSAIGGGEPFPECIAVLLGIFAISSVLTVILFLIRGKKEKLGKTDLYHWMEEKGFA